MSFPSTAKMNFRIEVPVWSDTIKARQLPPQPDTDESDADSSITGTKELSPRMAEPVTVIHDALPQPEESLSDEATADDTYIVPKGHGRFLFRYPLLQGAARTSFFHG